LDSELLSAGIVVRWHQSLPLACDVDLQVNSVASQARTMSRISALVIVFAAERQDVGAIGAPRVARDFDRVTSCGAHAGNFVCCYRAATPAPSMTMPTSAVPSGNAPRYRISEVGIIHCIFRIGTEIVDLMAKRSQKKLSVLLSS